MTIDIITLFPNFFNNFIEESIIKRAIDKNLVKINIHNLRDYSVDKNKKVDDYQFGGGEGMVLMIEPIYNAINKLKKEETEIILLTPQGQTYNQKIAHELKLKNHIILICGHYEGFDERIRTLITREISIGDFILTGGEIPAMILSDSIIRLLSGVINEKSSQNDSFENNLLDYPVYTKPVIFNGLEVPKVLLSGHHENIRKFRLNKQLEKTKERRPDLLEKDW